MVLMDNDGHMSRPNELEIFPWLFAIFSLKHSTEKMKHIDSHVLAQALFIYHIHTFTTLVDHHCSFVWQMIL